MRLTCFTDFGLRACMRMAAEPKHTFSIAELAALATAGIVKARRGKSGGVRGLNRILSAARGQFIARLDRFTLLADCAWPAFSLAKS